MTPMGKISIKVNDGLKGWLQLLATAALLKGMLAFAALPAGWGRCRHRPAGGGGVDRLHQRDHDEFHRHCSDQWHYLLLLRCFRAEHCRREHPIDPSQRNDVFAGYACRFERLGG
jgi:hypothetical protein